MHLRIYAKASLSGWSPTWESLWDAYDDLPAELWDAGIDGVEVAIPIVGDDEEDADTIDHLKQWAEPWLDAGMAVVPHPYTEGPANPASCVDRDATEPARSLLRVFETAAEFSRDVGLPVTVTYHAAKAAGEDAPEREELIERSARFFELANDLLADVKGPVSVVNESQLPADRDGDAIRIGDVPNEIVETSWDFPRVGVCWDTGHYRLATQRLGAPDHPPDKFIRKVTHMHLHDVIDGTDHEPPSENLDRLSEEIELAVESGKLSSLTLEYDYGKAVADANDADAVLDYLAETAVWVHHSAGTELQIVE